MLGMMISQNQFLCFDVNYVRQLKIAKIEGVDYVEKLSNLKF